MFGYKKAHMRRKVKNAADSALFRQTNIHITCLTISMWGEWSSYFWLMKSTVSTIPWYLVCTSGSAFRGLSRNHLPVQTK